MTTVTAPYIEIERKLASIGDEYGAKGGQSPFKGRNFMTDEVVCRKKVKGQPVWFELSYGRGIRGSYIYGVTFITSAGVNLYDDSTCCHTYEDVEEALEKMCKFGPSK